MKEKCRAGPPEPAPALREVGFGCFRFAGFGGEDDFITFPGFFNLLFLTHFGTLYLQSKRAKFRYLKKCICGEFIEKSLLARRNRCLDFIFRRFLADGYGIS